MNDQLESDEVMGPSTELTLLLDAARKDLPQGAEWAQLSAQMAPIWGGEGALGPDAVNPPASHVSPTSGANAGAAGAKAGALAGGKAGALVGAAKWLGVLGVVGVVGVGTWVAVREPTSVMPANSVAAVPSPAISMATVAASAPRGDEVPAPVASVASVSEQSVAPTASAAKASGAQRSTPSELALLKRARDALATNPERTLALCQQHQQAYPQGQLAQEREVLSIAALERLNRNTEAGQRRTRFGKTFPDSAHRSRVQGSKPQ